MAGIHHRIDRFALRQSSDILDGQPTILIKKPGVPISDDHIQEWFCQLLSGETDVYGYHTKVPAL
ncbi:hypothetical protein C1A50_5259 [Paenibacillus polymyxa]|nr:hypothetical protein C1A50_5259 [Paenibacillus polymyxa]